jgi:hypothetical protein
MGRRAHPVHDPKVPPMFSGPMFRWERQVVMRKRRPFVFRTVFTVVLAVAALVIGLIIYSANSGDGTQTRLLYFGRSLLIATICLELLFLLFFVPSCVGGAIAEEREKNTFPMLLLTRLTPIEIVLTKAFARWLPAANLVLTGLPALVAAAWLAGLELESALALLVLLSSSAFMASLAILASAQREHVGTARGQATGWIFGWLLGPPIVTVIPVTTGSLWGDLLVELKRLCSLVAPSSPLSLLTDPGWYYRTSAFSLEGRVALMIGLQTLFGLLAVGFAAGSLKAREKNPNWTDPTRGHRPPCGDDPIFWREFDLPMRRGSGSLFVLRLRYVWILVRAVLLSALTLVVVLLSLAVPIGLSVATIYYGQAAFVELWEYGYGGNGPFVERARFNMLIRAGTGLLAFLPAMFAATVVAARITTERDKKTWDAFLTTPLTGAEILRSKARVAVQGIWQSAWTLPFLWAIGLVFGVVTLPGIVLAAIDLVLAVWANVALGLYLGVRPATATAVSNRASLVMLALFAFHTPLLFAALASPPELAVVSALDVGLQWGLALAALAVPILTGLFARVLTRRTLARFDEWVGRPIAGGSERNAGPDQIV